MKVSSFFDYQGPGRISIARYAPRGTPAGFRVYKPLAPGPWFNSVSRTEYERRYAISVARRSNAPRASDLTAWRLGSPRHGYHSPNAKGNFRFERVVTGWRGATLLDLRRKR